MQMWYGVNTLKNLKVVIAVDSEQEHFTVRATLQPALGVRLSRMVQWCAVHWQVRCVSLQPLHRPYFGTRLCLVDEGQWCTAYTHRFCVVHKNIVTRFTWFNCTSMEHDGTHENAHHHRPQVSELQQWNFFGLNHEHVAILPLPRFHGFANDMKRGVLAHVKGSPRWAASISKCLCRHPGLVFCLCKLDQLTH